MYVLKQCSVVKLHIMHLIGILGLLIIPILYLHKCTIYYKFIYLIVVFNLPNKNDCKMWTKTLIIKQRKRENKIKTPTYNL